MLLPPMPRRHERRSSTTTPTPSRSRALSSPFQFFVLPLPSIPFPKAKEQRHTYNISNSTRMQGETPSHRQALRRHLQPRHLFKHKGYQLREDSDMKPQILPSHAFMIHQLLWFPCA